MKTEVQMIWVTDPSDLEAPWMVDAWDEFSIDNNPKGWGEAVEKARAALDGGELRIVTGTIDYDSVVRAFQRADIGEIEVTS